MISIPTSAETLLGALIVAATIGLIVWAVGFSLKRAGRPLPRWSLPVAISLSLVGYSIWDEYSWASRASAALPEGARIIAKGGDAPRLWAPWTYLAAPVSRLAALAPREAAPDDGPREAKIWLLDRHAGVTEVIEEYDCAAGTMRAPGGAWQAVAADNPRFDALCREGEG